LSSAKEKWGKERSEEKEKKRKEKRERRSTYQGL
jgi:hypothetical protein